MSPAHNDFRHCPHCGRRTRHSIVSERVLAPVLWCLGCFHTRIGDDEPHGAASQTPVVRVEVDQGLRLAG
ncbi:MAG: hypothetical protein Q7R40_13945 [Phaeospirillum sp.]|nr:hypothetical protein [Phaeospirillum sp.]